MKKNVLRAGLFLVALSLIFVLPASAQNGSGRKSLTDEEKAAKKDEVKGKLQERWETVTCKKVETRTRNRYQKYETNKTLHQQIYEKMKGKIQATVADFKAKGFDVSKVEADLVQLETKLQKLYTDHDALIQKMKETETGVCQMTKEEAGNKIKEVKQYRLETIKVDIKDIHSFYSQTLRPDLVELIQEVRGTIKPITTPSPTN